jgi:DNA-binding NarL/FixJ family response regulator
MQGAAASILVSDQCVIVAEAIAQLLDQRWVVGIVSDYSRLRADLQRHTPDLLIADLGSPSCGILHLVRCQRLAGAPTRSLILSNLCSSRLAAKAIAAGAHGFIPKRASGSELRLGVECVLRGQTFVSNLVSPLDPWSTKRQASPRQQEVLHLIVSKGMSAKRVAIELGISPRTAENHRQRLMESVGARTVAELIHRAKALGLEY